MKFPPSAVAPTLHTERLKLRPFNAMDLEALHSLLTPPEVLRYFPNTAVPSLADVTRWLAYYDVHWREHAFGVWALEEAHDGRLMGRCGLQYLPSSGETEVDYLLGQPFWGSGYATEAGHAALAYGFDHLPVTEYIGIVHPKNRGSQRVLQKLGFIDPRPAQYFGIQVLRYTLQSPPSP